MERVKTIDHPMYQLLKDESIQEFNQSKDKGSTPSFAYGDFRGLDLRGLDASGIDFSNAYFRGADLRGIDFRQTNLEGASIAGTKISGCFFPDHISADEIVMSLNHGTRLRYNLRSMDK